jgi:hypothetical protein
MQKCGLSITFHQLKMKVVELTQTKPTPFKNGILGNSWWYWFQHQHPKLSIQLVKGLNVYKAEGLTSQSCDIFYQYLQTLYTQHKYNLDHI